MNVECTAHYCALAHIKYTRVSNGVSVGNVHTYTLTLSLSFSLSLNSQYGNKKKFNVKHDISSVTRNKIYRMNKYGRHIGTKNGAIKSTLTLAPNMLFTSTPFAVVAVAAVCLSRFHCCCCCCCFCWCNGV